MDNKSVAPEKEIKCKTPILTLCIISFAMHVVFGLIEGISPNIFLNFLPCVLFFIYAFKFYKKLKATIIVPIIFIVPIIVLFLLFLALFVGI